KKGSAYEYYTPKPVAQGMWSLMEELGFSGGKVLDPCAGMGIFGATAPKNAVVDAVELDAVSGNINKFVNQKPTHNVTVSNFEKVAANTPDESYDAVITNVPFGDNSVRGGNQFDDAKYQNESLEAYFILRTLEKLKPNGLAMFITPPRCVSGRGLKEERLRSRASMLAEFMGAYRLPNKVFGAASADTITDVMVFKKHSRDALDKIEELSSTKIDALIDSNVLWQEFISGQYFKGEGKRFILGEFVAKDDTKYRDVDRVINDDSVQNISKLLRKFGGSRIDWEALDTQESDVISYNDGDTIYQNGQPLQYFDGVWQPVQLDEELLVKNKITESIMAKLSTPYDAFIYKISHEQATQVRTEYLNQGRTMALPNWLNLVLSQLDAYVSADKKSEHWNALLVGLSVVSLVKAYADDLEMNYLDSFKALSLAMKKYRTFKAESGLVSSLKAAIKAIGIHYKGTEYSALWRGERQSIDELQGELTADQQLQKSQYLTGSLYVDREQAKNIYKSENPNFDPLTDDEWVVAADGKRAIKVDDLCVGNLKSVLDTLDSEIALASDDDIRNNLLAAKKKARDNAHFTDVSKLSYKLNSPLVSIGEKLEFAKQFIDASAYVDTDAKGRSYVDINIKGSDLSLDSKLTNRIGDYFKNGTITLGGISLPKGVTAEQALAKLREKINAANTQFSVWVKANTDIQARLEATANNPENVFFKIANDDSPLEVDGISPEWKMHGYQNAEIRRQARQFGGINGFNVGLGKTATALVSVQHAQNIGVKNKTLFIVPSAVLSNWRKEAVTGKGKKGDENYVAPIYANGDDCLFVGLTVDKDGNSSVKSKDYDRDLSAILENRHKKIFMTYEAFQRIPMQEETVEKYVAHLRDVDSAFAELERAADDNKNESKIAFIANELMKGKSAAAPFFENMGIDSVVIDEGHSFKNSKEAFNFESAKFLSLPQASSRALDAQAKCWYVRGNTAKNDGVLLLTATPVTNSPLEIYSMLSLAVGEEQINKQMLGIRGADDFLKSVCTVENDTETSVDGISKDYAMFTGLDNLEILRSTIGNIANVQDAESVGAVFHLPESPENAEPIRLDANTMDKIKLYQQAYRAANAIKRDKPVEPDEFEALEIVVEETNEDASLIAEPFNLIQKMNNLSLDAELNKRVTFVFVAEDKKKIDAVVAAFNKLKIVVKGAAKLGLYTEQDSIVKTYKVKDGEKFYTRYDFQVKARYDEHQKAIILDSIEFGTQAKLEKILDDNELEFDYASTPKYAALVNNVKNELEKPRGLKRDGSKSRVAKQIVFSDMLATHNKIRRILNKKAGIPLHKITFISGQFNNEPEQLLEVQAGFNGFDDDNLYNIIIG
ncbi:MAG TPA: N-6 DNA methylase, partial [Acinetobacter sp.]|nr:N-6 DNA methylase [Acinetobacter sp.]